MFMQQNLVSGVLSADNIKAINASLASIRELMPFLHGLTPDERRSLSKMGSRSRAFVEQAQQAANHNPGLLARDFDLEEFNRDVALYLALLDISQETDRLASLIHDTMQAAGSDAFVAALEVYSAAQRRGLGTGMDQSMVGMRQRFRPGTTKDEATDAAPGGGQPAK